MSDVPQLASAKVSESTKVVQINIEEAFEPLAVEDRYSQVLLVVRLAGSVIGHVSLPTCGTLSAEAQEAAIFAELADVLWRRLVRVAFARATRASQEDGPPPSVSVIVFASNGGEKLRACLASIRAIDTSPSEILVVDECARGDDIADICSAYRAPFVRAETASSSARNAAILTTRADLLAFTNDACIVDRGWLDGLRAAFANPLVMAVAGYVGPLELETQGQRLAHVVGGGLERHIEPRAVLLSLFPVRDAASFAQGGNAVFRRRVFEEIALLPELPRTHATAFPAAEAYAFYRILAKGYRVVFDPARVVWQRLPSDRTQQRKLVLDSAASLSAYAIRCLVEHRELGAIRFWLARSCRDATHLVRLGWPGASATLAYGWGTVHGVSRALRSDWAPGRAPAPASPRDGRRPPAVVRADAPTLSVVIPSYNRREKLSKALNAFACQTYPPDRFEVIVVLDGSTDGSADLVRSLDVPYHLRLVEQRNEGVGAARNQGARAARYSVLVFSDDDVIPEVNCLTEHAAAHGKSVDGNAIAFGYCPPAVNGERLWELFLRDAWEDFYHRIGERDHQWTYLDFASGNISLTRSFFLSSGGFDADFRRRSEDPELGIRLLRRGARPAFCPGARARHELDTRLTTGLRHAREVGEYDVLLVRKHPEVAPRIGGLSALLRPAREGISSRALLAYRHPEVTDRLARSTLPLLGLYERLRLRKQWHGVISALLAHSYMLGLRDALPAYDDLLAFVAAVSRCEYDEVLPVALDEAGCFRVPPGATGPALELTYADQPLARIAAIEPGGIWDWEALTDRVVADALTALRHAANFDDLLGLVRSELHAHSSRESAQGGFVCVP
jgi:glycosyltransferase involved in cell wall biosynthesis